MRYSQLPFKASKTVSHELQSKNARLLTQAGFIHQEMAGVYTFLPLGLRVLQRIENIIRKEMDKIGVEILMTSLVPKEYWIQTRRINTVDVLMKTTPANEIARLKHDAEYILAPTHEDTISFVMSEYARSYKDLPNAVYQIQTKFRNEPRARSGLLRCREFRMKDLYSFHANEEDLKRYYEVVKQAYYNIFHQLGFHDDLYLALASGGDFTKDYSHEFQVKCDAGEDILFHVRSKNITFNREVAPSMAPPEETHDEKMKPMKEVKGIGIVGVADLCKFLGITQVQTTKTLLFENEKNEIIAAAVRGDYDINEEKLQKLSNSEKLYLASAEKVQSITGAQTGYAGLINLPGDVRVFVDESMKGRKNFEMGANKTHYHSVNVNFGRDLPEPEEFYDIKLAKEGDLYPQTGETYQVCRAAEVGNIFPLNTKFTTAFQYTYTAEDGSQKPVFMGSYGIGPSRILGVLVEKYADEKGLVWPENVAPFRVHLISIHKSQYAEDIYRNLSEQSIDVFYDDRDISAGIKFADADLFGIPVRLVVSDRTGERVEWKRRVDISSEIIDLQEVIKRLTD